MAKETAYAWNEDAVRRIRATVQAHEREIHRLKQNMLPHTAPDGKLWLPFKNNSSESAPAFGIMAVTTTADIVGGQAILVCDKPSTTFYRQYVINSSLEVAAGDYGFCTMQSPALILYDTGTPAVNAGWGPKSGQWTLSVNYPQTTLVVGLVDSTNKILYGTLNTIDRVLGKTDAAHAKAASGTVSIWAGTAGSESDTTINVTGVWNSFAAVAITKWVEVEWINGQPFLVAAEC